MRSFWKVDVYSISRPSWTEPSGRTRAICPPPRGHLGGQTAPKSILKRSKIEAKKQEPPKPIQDDLGTVLSRSWAVLGAILGRLGPQNRALALGGARFFEKSLFRCYDGSKTILGPTWANPSAKTTENDPQKGAQVDPKTT